jgi:hypothetical protein
VEQKSPVGDPADERGVVKRHSQRRDISSADGADEVRVALESKSRLCEESQAPDDSTAPVLGHAESVSGPQLSSFQSEDARNEGVRRQFLAVPASGHDPLAVTGEKAPDLAVPARRSRCHPARPIELPQAVEIRRSAETETNLSDAVDGVRINPAGLEHDVVQRAVDVSARYGLDSRAQAAITNIPPAVPHRVQGRAPFRNEVAWWEPAQRKLYTIQRHATVEFAGNMTQGLAPHLFSDYLHLNGKSNDVVSDELERYLSSNLQRWDGRPSRAEKPSCRARAVPGELSVIAEV